MTAPKFDHEYAPAASCLSSDTYPTVRASMLYGRKDAEDNVADSSSFTHYLRDFIALQPDAMFFTANSAVPVADSVRGAYAELGQRPPRLFAIRANSELSLSFDEHAGMFSASKRVVKNEMKAIKKQAEGMRAIVFDQYVETGGTLRLAKYMLEKSGVIHVGNTPLARWYEETRVSDIDVRNVTSNHSAFMRTIGHEAVRSFG